MPYQSEAIAEKLKRARQSLGLSQRALSERSGLTQSHISQIENGATEPGLSSLIDLARALDLEIMLIPRKRIPAVSSLVEDPASDHRRADPTAQRELQRGQALVEDLAGRIGSTASLDRLREALAFFRQVPLSPNDLSSIVDVLQTLKRQQDHQQIARRVREASETLWSLRNRLAHARPTNVRAAYALDDEDDADG